MPQIPQSLDTPAVTDAEIWQEADERLRISIEAQGENVTNAIEDLEFEDGNQWPTDLQKMRKDRPTLTINLTRTCVRRVCNNMRQQRPRIKVHPTGEGARVEDAKVWSGVIRHIETRSKASVAYDTGGESAVKIGWGYWRVLAEYADERAREQELRIKPIRNVFTVYEDPLALDPTGSDREWLIITEEMNRQKYKRLYPKAANAEYRRGGPGDEDHLWESKQKIRLAEYYRITKTQEYLHYLTDGTTLFDREWKRLKPILEQRGITIEKDAQGQERGRMSHRRTVEWFRLNGRTVIDRRALGGTGDKGPLPGRYIPVVRCEGNVLDLNGQIRRRGMIRDMKDSNRMYNYWASKETELVALAPLAPFIAAEGQTNGHPEWKDSNQKPYGTLVYNVVHTNPDDLNSPVLPPPARVEPVQIPAGVVNARQGAEHDLMALAGMPHEPGQDTPGTVVSGKALRQRQALSDIGHFQYYDNQTMAIAHTGEILVDLIPYYYSEQRIQRIIGEDGVPQMVPINQPQQQMTPQGQAITTIKNDLTQGKFDIVMDTGPGYETKRQENAELMVDVLRIPPLAETAVKTGADLIFRAFDMDDMADRLTVTNPEGLEKAIQNLPKEAQGIVRAMQGQLQQAQQTIQQQALEIKFKSQIEQGWMQVEREKIDKQTTTKMHDTSIKAQTDVFDTHVKSVTARDVAEINAGAKLIDSNQDRSHEKELAAMTAKAAERAEKSNGKANG